MSYYKTIDGKQMDGHLLKLAEDAVKGQGDGRISHQDAEILFAAVRDGGVYTDVEKETVGYIKKNFHWTESAVEWFSARITALELKSKPPQIMSPEELSRQQFPKKDVLDSDDERSSRHHDLRSATAETYQDHDEIGIIVQLENGYRVKVLSNFIELEGSVVELKGGYIIPVRAIEKVEV